MDLQLVIRRIEDEWNEPNGFFFRLREGEFDAASSGRVIDVLNAIQIGEVAYIHRRLVSLLWYMPIFMEWQVERVKKCEGDTESLTKSIVHIRNQLEIILGVP